MAQRIQTPRRGGCPSGRAREAATLRDLFSAVLEGRPAIAVIAGEPTLGKSTLLHSITVRAADSGAIVLSGRPITDDHAAPLSLVRNMIAETSGETARALSPLLEEAVRAVPAAMWNASPDSLPAAAAAPFRRITARILRASAETPVLIAVDDVHAADTASLLFLAHLARAVRPPARLLIVLTERPGPDGPPPWFRAALPDDSRITVLRLRPLSRAEQARLLAAHAAAVTLDRCDAVTGGNPLLVRAVLRDSRHPRGTVPGAAYTRAVRTLLDRAGPPAAALARAVALADGAVPAAALARLPGADAARTPRVLDALTTAGLLVDGRLRHPSMAAAILDDAPPAERAGLHLALAGLLHEQGASPVTVAGHLLSAAPAGGARPTAPWTVPVLVEAGERHLLDGDPRAALACLTLARRLCADERNALRVDGALARAHWLIDPAAIIPLLPALRTAVLDGRLRGDDAERAVFYLMWFGRGREADELLERLAGRPGATTRMPGAARLLLGRVPPGAGTAPPLSPGSGTAEPGARASAALAAVLTGRTAAGAAADPSGPSADGAAETAEQILRDAARGSWSPGPVTTALAVLLYDDRARDAARRCDPLLARAATRHDPAAHALLAATRALACVRLGDPAGAERHARTALARISPASWGTAIVLPISALAMALTATGRFAEAGGHLRAPVPPDALWTPIGLHHRQAHAHLLLATGHTAAALSEFQACGELMRRRGVDVPGLVAWRIGAAHTLLARGDLAAAAALASEQLARVRPGPSRVRGGALRALALASGPGERARLLREAVKFLEHSGDAAQLALARAELARAEHDRPDLRRAGRGGAAAALTGAERRVAALAAAGRTNRQIAEELLITVSTVEQHLTRVYRKLHVGRRTELPARLRDAPPEPGHDRPAVPTS
ncbi:helix-turn-helix transcriptional regulator [Actinomadura sp. WAC 06369]|uniref:helix-turn-helix transcriptional regulator n=1 Tax=Actinomadura sp. WAC 06369 TaxID=2203193 RepID=UPI000F770B10|nr:LuxR family transcriptional regulator [Actinomadura sp. WAC 06369]RSN50556.1 hypothetical protein DMH08_32525 [Actinomadura sp. WAC 06369]